jgi:PhzF family phenazine biosynthesis protein
MSVEVLRYAAFTDGGRGGNPAGVVLDAGSLTHSQMLAIAQAIGYSETAFLTRSSAQPRSWAASSTSDSPPPPRR